MKKLFIIYFSLWLSLISVCSASNTTCVPCKKEVFTSSQKNSTETNNGTHKTRTDSSYKSENETITYCCNNTDNMDNTDNTNKGVGWANALLGTGVFLVLVNAVCMFSNCTRGVRDLIAIITGKK